MAPQTAPGATSLLGPAAHNTLAPAVARAGGHLVSVRPTQVRHDPGRIVVRYAARVEWDRARRTETLGAVIDPAGLPDGLEVVPDELGTPIGVWRYPHDPYLPGLPHAAYPERVAAILHHLDFDAHSLEITPLVYRPSRRAVLRVRTSRLVLYLKVVRPDETAVLRATHDAFAAQVPTPRCLAWSDELGLLVLGELPGTPLTRRLVDGGGLPSPAAIGDVVARIRAVDLPAPRRAGAARVAWYRRVLQQAVPEAGAQIDYLVAAARDRGPAADIATHGDLYHAQLLIHGGVISGVLDLDCAGTGSRVDDPAVFLAHLLALAHVRPSAAARITAYRREVQAVLCAGVDPGVLAATVSGVLLGIATTAFRRQEPDWRRRTLGWLELAQGWAQQDVRSGGLV